MDVDIVCVGFGPATAGFLTTLSRHLVNPDGTPAIESPSNPGLPLQVMCYERADDVGFGVSGVVTRARGIRASLPDLDPSQIPMAVTVKQEKVAYLLDPNGASRRSATMHFGDGLIRSLGMAKDHAVELPYIPPFLHKEGGLVMSLGQFLQHVGTELMSTGTVQVWPGMPVQEALIEGERVTGIRLTDQGVDKDGNPEATFMPGMDVRAALTVVGDGPVGAVGRQLEREFGLPEGHHQREWAVGMKMVVDLPEDTPLEPGTVFHTFGYPEPEIFGFLYVHPDRVATVGHLRALVVRQPGAHLLPLPAALHAAPVSLAVSEGGKLRSWGAKSLQESGQRGEPFLAGDGYARIGECSGSTNVLTGSGVDEAWTTGVATRRSGARTAQGGQAAHQGKSRSHLRGAAARQLGGGGRQGRREGARRLPSRHDPRTARHGDRGLHRWQALRQRRAQTDAQPRRVLPREDSRRRTRRRSWKTAARAA